MNPNGLHILLTYQCTYQCKHCFVWGSPSQSGALSLQQIEDILHQARDAGVTSIYFEGGEPFLYYPVLVKGVHLASDMGFEVGIVTNAYWANTVADAEEWLRPMVGRLADFTASSDAYHCGEEALGEKPQNALVAAKWLGIPTGLISITGPGEEGTAPQDPGDVMFRGRAAAQLASHARLHSWKGFDQCNNEDLSDPGRIHLDPLGNLHICQGLVIGNLFEKPLKQIYAQYDPHAHPVCGPLLEGGPVALVSEYALSHEGFYADACHLCYEARRQLRPRFPAILGPDQMYGVPS